MHYLTKQLEFSATHRLCNPELSGAENDAIFDKCNNPNGHGHNYKLQVTVKGTPDPKTGYVLDLKILKRIITEKIVDKVDHKNLNFDVDFLSGIIPTSENLCTAFWTILESSLPSGELHRIRLFETDNSFVDYFGE